jgi:hypothetical protein
VTVDQVEGAKSRISARSPYECAKVFFATVTASASPATFAYAEKTSPFWLCSEVLIIIKFT